LVIAIPFRKGHHVAKHPGDFLPIIDHLEKLHEAGYVHGDIRAYNTLFQGSQGFLIDFDFGGKKCEQLFYPQGYNQLLPDGMRKGRGGMKIEVWHDWYALGWLIFVVHHIRKPVAKDEQQLWYLYLDCKDYWMALKTAPPKEKILELKDVLSKVQDRGWMIELGSTFLTSEESDTSSPGTKQGATGSPPKGPQT
jgi:serine/threonine protein kinase